MAGAVVLITGATSGLGLATAIGVARRGATVRFTARNRDRAVQARAAIADAVPGSDVDFLLADMSQLDEVRALADQLLEPTMTAWTCWSTTPARRPAATR